MATTKPPAKTPAKSPAKKSAAKKPAAPKVEKKSDYEVLLDARHEMEDAQLAVFHADKAYESARTILSSFEQRDAAVAVALEDLKEARERAAEATNRFEELKAAGRKG